MTSYGKTLKIIKYSSIVITISGFAVAIVQFHKSYQLLNNAVDTSVIHFLEPATTASYKCSEDNYLQLQHVEVIAKEPQFTGKLWASLKFTYAQRLLDVAKDGDEQIRKRAVQQLARIQNLERWQYSLLSNKLDARTAVGLARTNNVDLRFFLEPSCRYLMYDHEMIVSTMKELLVALNTQHEHACMSYFISKAFAEERFADYQSSASELKKLISSVNDILPLCLESLLHHSNIADCARDIVLLNGLPLMMEIYNRFRDDVHVIIAICKTLSNISEYPDLLEDVHKSGWIGVLAEWVKHEDIRISVPAAKTLSNLDADRSEKVLYPRRVFVLYPTLRHEQVPLLDVIFVHGLLGGVFFTWRQRDRNESTLGFLESISNEAEIRKSSDPAVREYLESMQDQQETEWNELGTDFEFVLNDVPTKANATATGDFTCPGTHCCVKQATVDSYMRTQCWPRDWLAHDCANVRILGINYNTSLSLWGSLCPEEKQKPTLENRSQEFIEKLKVAGVGKRPIVWVAHSMGGLLVKEILQKAYESDDKELQQIIQNSKGIIFFSTPHGGSRVANLSQATSYLLWPSVEVQELREDAPILKEAHKKFKELIATVPIKILSFVETKPIKISALKFNFLFVEPDSADPNLGEYFEIPQDHSGICKPANRQSFLYQKVVSFIKEIAKECSHTS